MNFNDLKKEQFLFLAKSGSHAYGTNMATSDTDFRGIFVASKKDFYGLILPDQASDSKNDSTAYELKRFMELLNSQNPNIIELLGIPEDCIMLKHKLYDRILENKHLFITRKIRDTFGGYAIAQIGKSRGLNKKITQQMDKVRKTPLDFCYVPVGNGATISLTQWLKEHSFEPEKCGLSSLPHVRDGFALFYSDDPNVAYRGVCFDDSNDIHLSSIKKDSYMWAVVFYNKDVYSKYCKDYKEYWEWVEKRNPHRYQKNLEVGKGYDTKNMSHCVRLLRMAEEMLRTGELIVRRPDREELLDIRNGKYDYEELITYAEQKLKLLDELVPNSPLPKEIDNVLLNNLLVEIREEFYNG